jgi:hypothetical protein
MALSDTEFSSILSDGSKKIVGDIVWRNDEDHSPSQGFYADLESDDGWPLSIRGSYNPLSQALSYCLVLKTDGRIYGLDLGKGHKNPDSTRVGDKHKHRWSERDRDKHAYEPEDITASVSQPQEVWNQFCLEANIQHEGEMRPPLSTQVDLFL